MVALLRCGRLRSIGRLQSLAQSIDHRSGVQQLAAGGKGCRLSRQCAKRGLSGGVQIGPERWHQRACAVGKHQRQVKLTVPMTPAKHIKRHALKGVARPNDGYLAGIVVKVVGSLSSGLSTPSHTGH
jgi:hypothetical protein